MNGAWVRKLKEASEGGLLARASRYRLSDTSSREIPGAFPSFVCA
jgi:hypothetical protein